MAASHRNAEGDAESDEDIFHDARFPEEEEAVSQIPQDLYPTVKLLI